MLLVENDRQVTAMMTVMFINIRKQTVDSCHPPIQDGMVVVLCLLIVELSSI